MTPHLRLAAENELDAAADALAQTTVEQRAETEDAGRDDERLGDGSVADRVGVRDGAVPDEVDAGGLRERSEAVAEGGVREPRLEESGGLGALTRGDDDDHAFSLPIRAGSCGALRY